MPIFHRCEDLAPILLTCDDLVPILHICENLVPILHTALVLHMFKKNYKNVILAYKFYTPKVIENDLK